MPRAKTDDQMLAELGRTLRMDYRGWVDFVDDNMVGNKKALKRFLPKLAEWQEQRGYPFEFSTEASINLADDEELLEMMRRANFFAIFVRSRHQIRKLSLPLPRSRIPGVISPPAYTAFTGQAFL